jgi:hypothetical protein
VDCERRRVLEGRWSGAVPKVNDRLMFSQSVFCNLLLCKGLDLTMCQWCAKLQLPLFGFEAFRG